METVVSLCLQPFSGGHDHDGGHRLKISVHPSFCHQHFFFGGNPTNETFLFTFLMSWFVDKPTLVGSGAGNNCGIGLCSF